MHRYVSFIMLALAFMIPKSVIADPADTQAKPEIGALSSDEKDHPLAVGVRLGLFPPVFSAPELTIRAGKRFRFGLYGIYLPKTAWIDAANYTIAGSASIEMKEGWRSGPYGSFGFLHWHRIKNQSGFYETWTAIPVTAGYLLRSDALEVQLGGGVQIISYDAPPCGAWCFNVEPPPILPALDLAVRYAF